MSVSVSVGVQSIEREMSSACVYLELGGEEQGRLCWLAVVGEMKWSDWNDRDGRVGSYG